MNIESIEVENFTVFGDEKIMFSKGINIVVAENGMGKTHLLKLLYAASQAVDPRVSFSQKIVRCFLPDDYRISRLVKRQQGSNNASVKITSCSQEISGEKTIALSFNYSSSRFLDLHFDISTLKTA